MPATLFRLAPAIVACFVLLLNAAVAGESRPLRILFIGNSYTSYNDLPQMIAELAKAGGQQTLEVEKVTRGGFTFERHLTESKALERIAAKNWDYVVLQEQSLRPINDPALMLKSGKELAAAAKKQGSKTILYLTWSRENTPETQPALTKAYSDLAAEADAAVAPAGIAWSAILKADPAAGLHRKDKSHPTTKGTYLTACVFYATLFDESPEGLPGILADLDENEALKLQQAAWKAVEESRGASK